MKASGIVRKVDLLGRIVIPKELRQVYHLDVGASVEIFTTESGIVLRPYHVTKQCIVTGVIREDNILLGDGTYISKEALREKYNELEEQ